LASARDKSKSRANGTDALQVTVGIADLLADARVIQACMAKG
jgi:hypothetical protein